MSPCVEMTPLGVITASASSRVCLLGRAVLQLGEQTDCEDQFSREPLSHTVLQALKKEMRLIWSVINRV